VSIRKLPGTPYHLNLLVPSYNLSKYKSPSLIRHGRTTPLAPTSGALSRDRDIDLQPWKYPNYYSSPLTSASVTPVHRLENDNMLSRDNNKYKNSDKGDTEDCEGMSIHKS
jgi:hypothetical protein